MATQCREGLVHAGLDPADLRYEVGVSEFGEWMNFRIYFPDQYSLRDSSGERVGLRLVCFNAVERFIKGHRALSAGTRFVCANGMVIG